MADTGQLNIETLYAFIVRDDDGTEGVVGHAIPGGGWMPLVGADLARVASLERYAQEVADATGKTIQVVHFSKRDDVKSIEPNRSRPLTAVRLSEKIIGIANPS